MLSDFPDSLHLSDTITGDLSLLLLFVGLAMAFGFVFGRTKLLSVMIDVYVARALVAVIPGDWISAVDFANVIVFTLVFVFLLITDQRLFDIHLSNRGSDFFWRIGVMSLLVTGMVVSSFLFFFPEDIALDYLSKTVYGYFTAPLASVFWMVMPLFMLFFINRRLAR
jgi:hypothetical protein